jgi:hypothetical protein
MAPIAQLAEAADLKSAQCRFESDWGHGIRHGRGGSVVSYRCLVPVPVSQIVTARPKRVPTAVVVGDRCSLGLTVVLDEQDEWFEADGVSRPAVDGCVHS